MTEQSQPPSGAQPQPAGGPPQPPAAAPAQPAQARPLASFEDFAKLEIRVAKVLAVRAHPNADKLIVLDVDLGTEKRQIIAGLKPYVAMESLAGKNIVVVANLEPRKMRGLESNGMLLAASWEQDGQRRVTILTTDGEVPPGSPIS